MITEKEQELKPCPFCGSTHIVVVDDDDERYPYVQCCDCNTSTDVSPTKEEAVEWWNHRAAPQWSQEPPTEEGWYWVKKIPKNSGVIYPEDIVYVSDAGGKFYVLQLGVLRSVSFHHFCHAFQEVLWCKIDAPPPLRGACCTKESTMKARETNDT